MNQLGPEQALAFVDAVADTGWSPILVLSGGEPLMRKDLFAILARAKQRGLIVALATNATLVDEGLAKRLHEGGVVRASVSLDGADAATHDSFRGLDGSFEEALRGIRALRDADIAVQINVTFTKRNVHQAARLVELVGAIDACALHSFVLVPVGCGVEIPDAVRLEAPEVERLLTLLDREASTRNLEIRATCTPQAQRIRIQRKRAAERAGEEPGIGLAPSSKGCLAGGGILFVDAVGKVFPCGYLPISVGDVHTQTLKEILASSAMLAQLRDVERLEGRCHGCEYAPVCGGCRARAFGTTGNLFGEEPSCPMGACQSA